MRVDFPYIITAATPGSATSQSARAESSWSDASRSHSRSQLNVAGIEAAQPRRIACEATCSSQSAEAL